jgi:ABC-2 type transport system permease protein
VKSIKTLNRRFAYAAILLKQLVKTDFKLRYQGSALGYLWSLLKPLFLFVILYTVFVRFAKVDYGVDNSGVYLLLGIVIWTFFSEVTSSSVTSIVSNGDLLRKLNFPRYVIVLAVGFSALINLMLNMIIVTIFMIVGGVDVGLSIVFVPLLFIELFAFSLAIGFFLSAAYVRLRDINHIWEVVMQALFYLTPILFPLSFAPLWAQKFLIINPLAQIIQDLRYILVSRDTITIDDVFVDNPLARLIPLSIVAISVFVATKYFRARSKYFAEEI